MTDQTENLLRFRQDFHDRVQNLMAPALDTGVDPDAVAKAMAEAMRSSANAMANYLAADRPQMLADHAEMWADVESTIREIWGDALDRLYAIIVGVEELGRIWDYANHADAERDQDLMFVAMSSLLARATRSAFEVHVLLTRGFPSGAAARARSLYELAVVARVMVEHGPDLDLPRRYLNHSQIDQFLWAREYQSRAKDLGRDPFTDEEMTSLTNIRSDLVREFGESFDRFFGWASPLFPDGGSISAVRLASKVDMEWGRPDYMADSHDVHPTSWGGELNQELGGQVGSWRLTGLADPANATMVRFSQVLGDALVYGRTGIVNQYDVLGISTIFRLVEEAEEVFLKAERAATERIMSDQVHPEPPR